MAPEVIRNTSTSLDWKSIDCYQFGMIVYQILYRKEPFSDNPMPKCGKYLI